MTYRKPILVTGSHRSGSTWVGKVISASPSVIYIHEPFNLSHEPGLCTAKFDYWFTYISDENQHLYYDQLKKTMLLKYSVIEGMKEIRSLNDAKTISKNYARFFLYRHRNARPLIKDPIAFFSAEWLSKTFDMNVLILIRHPAAFASSLKRLNWTHPFSHFLQQPLLMKDYLYPFEEEIKKFAEKEHDIIDQSILLWKIVHYLIIKYKDAHKDWIFLRHEDISMNPAIVFQDVFEKLDLEFTESVRMYIQESSNFSNPSEAPKDGSSLKRDSRSNIWNWKSRLTESEIERIRNGVKDISIEFYSDNDW